MVKGIIEKGYLYKLNFVRDIEDWETDYYYISADTFEEAVEVAEKLVGGENECIIDLKQIKHKQKGDAYAVFTKAPK